MYGPAKNTGYLRHLTGVIRSQETCAAAQVAAPTLAGGDNPVNALNGNREILQRPKKAYHVQTSVWHSVF